MVSARAFELLAACALLSGAVAAPAVRYGIVTPAAAISQPKDAGASFVIVGEVNVTFSAAPLVVPSNALAWATYNDSISSTGWSRLDIAGAAAAANETLVAFAAGALEGVLTQRRAYEFNTNNFRSELPAALSSYIEANWAWTNGMAATHAADELWYQVGLLNAQVSGMWAGYSAVAPANESLPFFRFLLSTLQGDMDDLRVVFPADGSAPVSGPRGESHCSVLLKTIVNASSGGVQDVLASHTTWSQFESMTRIWRVVDLPFSRSASDKRLVPGRLMSFSSYPGTMHSDDDWYLLAPSGLLVTETTIENNNASLWQYVVPQTIPDWARNMAANRLAQDGASWVAAFSQYNSGTYNNAFSVVDAKRLTATATSEPAEAAVTSPRWYAPVSAAEDAASAGSPQAGLLTKLEQMPGPWIRAADLSAVLAPPPAAPGFHSSYNRIMNPELFQVTNQTALVAAYGPHFSYNGTARALIFDRLQSSVTDFNSLAAVMRHNAYQSDPEGTQGCAGGARSASDAIAERGDLTAASAVCVPGLSQQDEAGIDAKMASVAGLAQAVATLQLLQGQYRAQAAAGGAATGVGHTDSSGSKHSHPRVRGSGFKSGSQLESEFAGSAIIESIAISGPTTEGQPPFVWSQSPFASVPHVGQPDAWNFPWVSMTVDASLTSAALPDDLAQVPAAALLPASRVWW